MLSVTIHKDIGEYTEKIVGKMSARTLACVAGGLATSVATACAVYFGLGIPVADATMPVMAASMPFWLAGFWKPKGLKAEQFISLYIEHALGDARLVYVTGSAPHAIAGSPACQSTDRKARRAAKQKGAERREPSKEQD